MDAFPAADSEPQSRLSQEVRRLRREQALSLEALAARSGVSRSMISKIERDETMPSTAILSRLAEALGTRSARLAAPSAESEMLLIPAHRQPVLRDEASGLRRRCLSPVFPGRGIDWVLNTLPPAGSSGLLAAHRPGISHYVYVLRGRLRIVIGARSFIAEPGDSLYFEADAEHSFTNVGMDTCDYFLVIDPSRAMR